MMMLDMGRQEACAMADLVALRSVITPLVIIKSTKKLLESPTDFIAVMY